MKTVLRSLMVVVFFSLIVPWSFMGDAAAPADETHAGTAADPWVLYYSTTGRLAFDNAYVTRQIVKAEAEITLVGGGFVKTVTVSGAASFPKTDAAFVIPIYTELMPLSNGTYTIRARVTDANGNTSGWCAPIYATKQWIAIDPPGGCVILR